MAAVRCIRIQTGELRALRKPLATDGVLSVTRLFLNAANSFSSQYTVPLLTLRRSRFTEAPTPMHISLLPAATKTRTVRTLPPREMSGIVGRGQWQWRRAGLAAGRLSAARLSRSAGGAEASRLAQQPPRSAHGPAGHTSAAFTHSWPDGGVVQQGRDKLQSGLPGRSAAVVTPSARGQAANCVSCGYAIWSIDS